jgi:DNA primase
MKPLFAQLNVADAEPALRYMTQRGYSKVHIAQAMTHYATEGYFHDRVIFPHYYKERLWGWTARDYTGRSPSPKLFPAGMTRELLYNQEVLELETKVPCFVVESVTSSIRLLPHVCATLGQPTDTHFETLAKVRSRPLIITLDGDRWRNCRRMARELRDSGCNAKAILLPPGEDPDTVSATKLAEAREYLLTNPDKELDLVQKDMVEVDYDY